MSLMLLEDSWGDISLDLNESSGGRLIFKGKFQEAESINKNKRMYPFKVLDENVKKIMETVKQRGLMGELDHPTDSIIHMEKASHLITKLWWEGNTLMGEGEILPTPHGKILKTLLDCGVRTGISSRGVGSGTVDENGILVIGESYKLITFDAVADPSTTAAFQKVVKSENKEYQSFEKKNEDCRIDTGVNKDALIAHIGGIIRHTTKNMRARL